MQDCSAAAIHGELWVPNGYVTVRNFMLFEGSTLTTFPLTTSKTGLMVITLEPYFKTVHTGL